MAKAGINIDMVICPDCWGTKYFHGLPCKTCDGYGIICEVKGFNPYQCTPI